MQKPTNTRESAPIPLWSLFVLFIKIGGTAFGGFMALISAIQSYVVDRRKLLKHEDMLDGISLATILPGPVAVNVVAYVGYRLRGGPGALVSAVAVILPAFFLLVGLSYSYFTYGQVPVVGKFFSGFIPAVAAIILSAAWNMGTKTIKGLPEALVALTAFGLLIGIGGFYITVAIIGGSGFIGWLLFHRATQSPMSRTKETDNPVINSPRPGLGAIAVLPLTAAPLMSLQVTAVLKLFTVFAGMSLLLFGGGYVFIPLMQQSVVDHYGWVTRQEFIDAIAMGQVTPGPILISAAFIGYKVAGLAGAVAATAGIYTPPALVMLASTRFLDRIKASDAIKSGLRGVRSAIIGMIAAAAITVIRSAEPNWISAIIFLGALAALLRYKVETAWIIPIAGTAGLLLY